MMNRDAQDIFDFFFLREGVFVGGFADIAKAVDCEYITAEVVEKVLSGNLYSTLFCIYWEQEDNDGKRIENSDIEKIFLLDTVWEKLIEIGKYIIGEVTITE